MRPAAAPGGGSSSHGGDEAGGVAIDDLRPVPVGEAAHVCPRAVLGAGQERHRAAGAAAHEDPARDRLDRVEARARRSIGGARAERLQDTGRRRLGDAGHRPGVAGVEPGVVRVVAGDREARPARVEQHVPVHGREAAAVLDLAARVVDLDADDRGQPGHLVHRRAAPVGVREVGDAAVCSHELHRVGQVRVGALVVGVDVGLALEAVDEHVDPSAGGRPARELDPAQEHHALARGRLGDRPVVGDGERIPLGELVVVDERRGLQLAVGAGRVGVERAAQPRAVGLEGVRHRGVGECTAQREIVRGPAPNRGPRARSPGKVGRVDTRGDAGDPGAAPDRGHDRRAGRRRASPRRSGRRTSSRSPRRGSSRRRRCIRPRACSAAMRAERPGAGGRAVEPAGRDDDGVSVTAPTPCHGSAIWTMLTPAMAGFSGWTHGSCSRAAAGSARRRATGRVPRRARSRSRAPRASAIAYHMPP